jgi:ABC-type branched-subunit amino acid transport system ATPase component
MSDAVLEVRSLTAGYGPVPILHGVDLEVRASAITVVVGLNGAGKSTLLKAVLGLITSTHGDVLLEGVSVLGKPPEVLVRMGVSYVPQVANVFPTMTVRENLEMGGIILRSGVNDKIAELCEMFPDLAGSLKRRASTLSGGQRHMLAVARALMVSPKVLLLDEPTVGLAPIAERALWERIKAIRETGVAVLVVDQNVRRALGNSNWGYVLSMGRNLVDGPGHELLASDDVGNLYSSA